MKVILTEEIPNLGSLGDEVIVKSGYARNYLIPQEKAILVTNKQWKTIQHQRLRLEKLRQDDIQKAQILAEKIKSEEWKVIKKVGVGGRLYGSVTNRDLEALFENAGYNITRRAITLNEPIKAEGTHKVTLKLHTEVRVPLSIQVIPELVEGGIETTKPSFNVSEPSIEAESLDDSEVEGE